jgi:hypothetical protein
MAKKEADFTNLSSDQLGNLQQMLRDFTTGQEVVKEPVDQDPVCCHSSHFDNDGWI